MRIMLAGGGSGGHVTPLRAISESLLKKSKNSTLELTVISDRAFFTQTEFLFKDQSEVTLRKIFSGKLRRYNNKSMVWHLTHAPTILKNIRDILLIGIGVVQAIAYFIRKKPDVVFCKGGYVCVPVGVAARLFNVPMVIHDSDTHPGLTNKFLSRWAVKIGTGMPTKYYQYPVQKMVYSGIPIRHGIQPVNDKTKQTVKKKLGLTTDKPVLLVTGGGTGARELNDSIIYNAEALLESWQVVQQTGKGKAAKALKVRKKLSEEQQKLWQIHEFADMLPLIQASDIIVSRAGATAMQEFANAAKPVLLLPNPYLTGGHQLKNAELFLEEKAVRVIQETDLKKQPDLLVLTLKDMQHNTQQTKAMAQRLYTTFAKPAASDEIAELILDAATSTKRA